jgi:hypothetical protein
VLSARGKAGCADCVAQAAALKTTRAETSLISALVDITKDTV